MDEKYRPVKTISIIDKDGTEWDALPPLKTKYSPTQGYVIFGQELALGMRYTFELELAKVDSIDGLPIDLFRSRSLLSDEKIWQYYGQGRIVIEPFNIKNLGNCSYDVRLGDHFYRETKGPGVVISDFGSMDRLWIPGKLMTADEVKTTIRTKLMDRSDSTLSFKTPYDIKPGTYIPLEPGETILAHTGEFIGGRGNITSSMSCRSSYGRVGITVCKCSGWGDIGYINRYTMEITNNLKYNTVYLMVGQRIAQIIFYETDRDSIKSYSGSYQKGDDLETIMKEWKPEMMLPRIKID